MTRRIRAVGEAAVPDWVAREARKFEYPDFDTIAPAAQSGGGGGAPTVVVAASDATDLSKSKADLVCTGVNDETTIEQAAGLLGSVGGRILLTEGTFNIDMTTSGFGAIALTGAAVHVVGMGPAATKVDAGTTSGSFEEPIFIFSGTDVSLQDMSVLGTGGTTTGVQMTGDRALIENCYFDVTGPAAILSALYHRVVNNHMDSGSGVVFTGTSDGDFSYVANNIITVTGAGISFGGNSTPQIVTITGNVLSGTSADDGINLGSVAAIDCTVSSNTINGFDNGIEFDGQRNVAITGNAINAAASNGIRGSATSPVPTGRGNVIVGNTILEPGANGIFVDGDSGGGLSVPTLIANNKIHFAGEDGISFDDIDEVTVVGNLIVEPDQHGIATLDQCNRFHVYGNTIIRPGQETDDSYDGIFLNTNCSEWFIHGNHILGDASAPQPRYAINISAASDDCNRVVGNNGDGQYASGNINDAGTNTILDWPNDPTDGDNVFECGSPGSP